MTFVRVLIKVIDPAGVERGSTPFNAVHLVALLQQQLRQVAAVLASNAGDQSGFSCGSWHGGKKQCTLGWATMKKNPEESL